MAERQFNLRGEDSGIVIEPRITKTEKKKRRWMFRGIDYTYEWEMVYEEYIEEKIENLGQANLLRIINGDITEVHNAIRQTLLDRPTRAQVDVDREGLMMAFRKDMAQAQDRFLKKAQETARRKLGIGAAPVGEIALEFEDVAEIAAREEISTPQYLRFAKQSGISEGQALRTLGIKSIRVKGIPEFFKESGRLQEKGLVGDEWKKLDVAIQGAKALSDDISTISAKEATPKRVNEITVQFVELKRILREINNSEMLLREDLKKMELSRKSIDDKLLKEAEDREKARL